MNEEHSASYEDRIEFVLALMTRDYAEARDVGNRLLKRGRCDTDFIRALNMLKHNSQRGMFCIVYSIPLYCTLYYIFLTQKNVRGRVPLTPQWNLNLMVKQVTPLMATIAISQTNKWIFASIRKKRAIKLLRITPLSRITIILKTPILEIKCTE
ncbi:hypothetical protein DMN91_004174 [Ooceraea biroi]|uniref:Uncharacterized protein n=1 Tax=Ooceraea biroi TaxID=2015173 RepID=A0A3L8DUL6_OOCBI|nr:hypothetical protein DMN91_004174 [Ooceraea biroi]